MPSFEPANPNYEPVIRASFSQQGIMRAIGAELLTVAPGLCRIRLPFSERVSQQHGYFHGGLVATIGDSAGGYAAMTLCPPGGEVLTVEYKVNFLAPAQGDDVVATGRVIKNGRTLIISQIEVEARNSGSATLCAMMQQTMMAVMPRAT